MKRRDFLAAGILTAGAFTMRRVLSTPTPGPKPRTRGAVVIGVDKVGNLPTLKAAGSGARKTADWLDKEGFEVKLFVDDGKQVAAPELLDAVDGFINAGTFDQLVVYFAGHGCITSTVTELWLLSNAHRDPNAAVSLNECCTLAQTSGIPNVVFISDACRSRPDSLGAQFIRGSVIFPIQAPRGRISDVDRFLATRVGAAAYEYTVDKSSTQFQAIFTECFLDAFQHPDDGMVETVSGERIIPNRRLKGFLAREVPKRARAVQITLQQEPDCQVLSEEPTYIGHGPAPTTSSPSPTGSPSGSPSGSPNPSPNASPTPPDVRTPTISDVAKVILNSRGFDIGASTFSNRNITEVATDSGFNKSIDTIQRAQRPATEIDIHTGFIISGEGVISAVAGRGVGVKLAKRDAESIVDVNLGEKRAVSVALRFANGSGTILAALDKYVGNVVIVEGKVANVSYFPSPDSYMRQVYEQQAPRLKQLHAIVATAARFGVFRIEGSEKTRRGLGEKMADQIRMLKAIDPTLGVYASYAYADAGLLNQVRSVRDFMRENLQGDLFDVAMLAGVLSKGRSDDTGRHNYPTPFCPMLSQGWGQLRVRQVALPEPVAALQDHLQLSLWTTFDELGIKIAEEILKSGRVT